MSKHNELSKAADKMTNDKANGKMWKNENEKDRQIFVRGVISEMCEYLGWPDETVNYVDVAMEKVVQGSVKETLPPLHYPQYPDMVPGEVSLFQSGVEMRLKHGKGELAFWLSFHHMNSEGPGSMTFRGESFDLRKKKNALFDAVTTAIRSALDEGNPTSPNKEFFV